MDFKYFTHPTFSFWFLEADQPLRPSPNISDPKTGKYREFLTVGLSTDDYVLSRGSRLLD